MDRGLDQDVRLAGLHRTFDPRYQAQSMSDDLHLYGKNRNEMCRLPIVVTQKTLVHQGKDYKNNNMQAVV